MDLQIVLVNVLVIKFGIYSRTRLVPTPPGSGKKYVLSVSTY